MISRTATTVVDAPSREVFEFLSAVDNLSPWRPTFARELKYEHRKPKVNGLGEFHFSIDADPHTGVIDMQAGPTEDELTLFPGPVVALAPRRSAFTFMMFKAPEMDDALFEAQYRSVQRELQNIRARSA